MAIKAKLTTFDTTMIVVSLVRGLISLLGALIFVSGYPIFLVMRRLRGGKGLK